MKGYDIKIRLDDFRPLTWRDLIIPENFTFKELHECIQIIYGLDDFLGYHLYQFSFKDSDIRITDLSVDRDFYFDEIDSNTTYIDEYFKNNKKIYYLYDFGDGWSFTIEIKKIVDYDENYPTLKRFKGEYNPIQDCGGVGGLGELLYYKDHPNEVDSDYKLELIEELVVFDLEDAQYDLISHFDD